MLLLIKSPTFLLLMCDPVLFGLHGLAGLGQEVNIVPQIYLVEEVNKVLITEASLQRRHGNSFI